MTDDSSYRVCHLFLCISNHALPLCSVTYPGRDQVTENHIPYPYIPQMPCFSTSPVKCGATFGNVGQPTQPRKASIYGLFRRFPTHAYKKTGFPHIFRPALTCFFLLLVGVHTDFSFIWEYPKNDVQKALILGGFRRRACVVSTGMSGLRTLSNGLKRR